MKESAKTYIENCYPEEEFILCEGFDDQFLGIGKQFNSSFAVYSKDGCIKQLMKKNLINYEEAEEYFLFNIQNAYVGEKTPIFLESIPIK